MVEVALSAVQLLLFIRVWAYYEIKSDIPDCSDGHQAKCSLVFALLLSYQRTGAFQPQKKKSGYCALAHARLKSELSAATDFDPKAGSKELFSAHQMYIVYLVI